jgi:hypothetical protein
VIAEIESVLSEVARIEPRQLNPKRGQPGSCSTLRRSSPDDVDFLRLDSELDFVIGDEGAIAITEAGVRRMLQAHTAGLDVVIEFNGREVVRFLSPKRGFDTITAGKPAAQQSVEFAELTGAIAQRTQPILDLLKAEQSPDDALRMIDRERRRYELELLLPWHAIGKLSDRDAQQVEQALAEDRVLAQRYELLLEELAAAVHLNEALGSPSARATQKLFAAIDAEESHHPRSRQQSCSESAVRASAPL